MNLIEATRLARICAYSTCAAEWEQFVRLITPAIALTAWRVGRVWHGASEATVQEIVQETLVKLCEEDRRILRTFEDRGQDSFAKLLRVVCASVGSDYFRRIRAVKRGGRSGVVPLEACRIEEDMGRARPRWSAHEGAVSGVANRAGTWAVESPALLAQLDGLLRRYPEAVSARDRSLFWLYYQQGFTAEAISRIPAMRLSVKGVESALLRMTRLLRKTIAVGKLKPKLPKESCFLLQNQKGSPQRSR